MIMTMHETLLAGGADLASAIGQLSASCVAVVAVVVTLFISAKDRRRADYQAKADRVAASERAADAWLHELQVAENRRVVDLLMQLSREIGRSNAYAGAPQSAESAQMIRVILRALPEDCAVLARSIYNVLPADGEFSPTTKDKLAERTRYLTGQGIGTPSQDHLYTDIADDVFRYNPAYRKPTSIPANCQDR